jgi:hypothetical protein
MGSAKARLIQVIQEQPDDSSPEEILRELAFAVMVERGIADSDAGRTVSMKRWAVGSSLGEDSLDSGS